MKITLITCTYNAADVLQRTLDSVLHQTYADIEHLIIDGKSKDNTVIMAEEYRTMSDALHTRHKVIIRSEPDKGLYDAMNKGIMHATGSYLCFLNAGDCLYDKDAIANIVASAEAGAAVGKAGAAVDQSTTTVSNASALAIGKSTKANDNAQFSVIYGETDIVDDNGTFLHHRHHKAPESLTWRSFRDGMLVCHQSFYANTAIAKQTPYDLRYRLSADVDWCIRIMKEGSRRGMETHNTHQVLCNYLDGGMSVQNHRASLIERFKVMASHYGLMSTIKQHLWFVVRAFRK